MVATPEVRGEDIAAAEPGERPGAFPVTWLVSETADAATQIAAATDNTVL